MTKKLSIIIPCYNCAKTLKEAVDSCYQQGLDETEFEIIMVDDGSIDSTADLMKAIAAEHKNIKLLFHTENRGGGAARNTGIKEAQGEVIYCLDSDNFFAPNSVKPILDFLYETGVDGVAFFERRFFVGNNTKRYSLHKNNIVKRNITLSDVLSDNGILLDNFFYTKDSYLKTKGYPENHGFDTQCFEIRFLSVGNTVRVCPKTIFWHRQAGGGKSYFERVYESGEYSLNMYYILEDIMHLLSTEVRSFILNFNVFEATKLDNKNLLGALVEKYGSKEDELFGQNYKKYLTPGGFETYRLDIGVSDILIEAINLYKNKQYSESSLLFMKLLPQYKDSTILYLNIIRCSVGISGVSKHDGIEKNALRITKSLTPVKQKIDLNPNFFKRLIFNLVKTIR